MKKSFIYILAATTVALATAACTKEQDTQEPQEENNGLITESLSAQKEDEATKITMNSSRQFGWSTTSDKAAFSIYDGANYEFVDSKLYGATASGKFTVVYPSTSTRQGFAVVPSTFAKSLSADGTTLTVTYPDSYDISADVDAGTYDNANGSKFIPFPMVATSISGNTNLTFYSIGALVKVVVSHVPAGTKNLYITFNQTVTGDFVVSDPGTSTPTVAVSSSTSSTVAVKISEVGLAAEQTITLYIPVPTTTNLCIASVADANKKATVVRNKGYQFSCDAITRNSPGTTFSTADYNYILSPGNLVKYKEGGEIKYKFYSGYDQLKTTAGSDTNNPHRIGATMIETITNNGEYQDMFTWNELYQEFMGTPSAGGEESISKKLTIDGEQWKVLWHEIPNYLFISANWRNKLNTIIVGNGNHPTYRRVTVNVAGSPYANYALLETSSGSGMFDIINGYLIFPDGVVDQTDLLYSESGLINFEAFKKYVDAEVYFMPIGFVYSYSSAPHKFIENTNFAYWLRESRNDDEAWRLTNSGATIVESYASKNYGRLVRLMRQEESK